MLSHEKKASEKFIVFKIKHLTCGLCKISRKLVKAMMRNYKAQLVSCFVDLNR